MSSGEVKGNQTKHIVKTPFSLLLIAFQLAVNSRLIILSFGTINLALGINPFTNEISCESGTAKTNFCHFS